ncbi:MAG: adenylosuccinate synthetase [Candidatus Competibacter sp.]|nr:adenylosuccinate synthetase [Candidatus Competibacter sp.]MDG4583939.1 adenylosuccinate synthetase [Candidatus Competibacter sp.]
MHPTKTAHVVIGAQFGDEGKGRLTDYRAAQTGGDALVVRFNGGAQAGHTVVAPDGRRHVFSHIGSGTLAGAATYLSRFFVANPILFLKEVDTLATLDARPVVYADPASPVTTPYDMMINQIVERERGDGRHGSCGIGFGETLERNLDGRFALTVADLADPSALTRRLDAIRREYAPARLARLGFAHTFGPNADLFRSDAILARYVEDAERFLDATITAEARTAIGNRPLVFEGAQGLLLDQDRGCFPHVTRSNTGLRNVLTLANEWGLERLDVTYATRAYLTRHGAGPLPRELPEKPYPGIVDETNRPNAYQGALRFAWLDLDLLGRAVREDLSDAAAHPALTVNAGLAITCLDQLGGAAARYYREGRPRQTSLETFAAAAAEAVGVKQVLLSFGPGGESTLHGL